MIYSTLILSFDIASNEIIIFEQFDFFYGVNIYDYIDCRKYNSFILQCKYIVHWLIWNLISNYKIISL
jgi:hypothetical protein